jgi:tetratricopeptide (TPR) repeat protein
MTPDRGPLRCRLGRAALLAITVLPATAPRLLGAAAESPAALVARGDALWERRAAGRQGDRADAGPVGEAVAAYEEALAASPEDIAIRVRLLRALYFQGQFATPNGTARRAIHAHGRERAEEGIERLAAELDQTEPFDLRSPAETAAALTDRPESAALFFWAAAHLGLWAESSGAFAAARQGVAGKIRDYAEIVIRVDERYEGGGGHRILGRLHTEAPRIPLITGWVDRNVAVASLERALELAPDDPLNRLYLADALLRFRPRRRDTAVAMLEALIAERPRPEAILQDERTLTDARRLLAATASRHRGPSD